MTTIESTPLDGGICNSKFSVNDMKAKGWSVDDIKISQTATGMNFIYILKTASTAQITPAVAGNQADMEARIVEKLEKKKEAEAKAKEERLKAEAEAAARAAEAARQAQANADQTRKKAAADNAARVAAEERARAEQAAREAQAQRVAAERKAAVDDARQKKIIADATKEADDVQRFSTVDRMMNGGFEANRGRLPMPITGGYKVVSHFGQYNVEGLRGVTLDNKGINIKGAPG